MPRPKEKTPYIKRSVDEMMVLESIQEGDMIRVKWVDACKVDNVSLEQMEDNRVYATYMQHDGTLQAVKRDKLYGESFLVLSIGVNSRGRHTIVCIPFGCIKTLERFCIEPLRKGKGTVWGKPVKYVQDVGTPFLVGKEFPIIATKQIEGCAPPDGTSDEGTAN